MLVKGDVQAESCFGNRPNRTEDRRGASRDHLPHTSLCFSQTGPNHETSSLPSRENRSATSCFHVRQDERCAHFYSRSFLLWQYLVSFSPCDQQIRLPVKPPHNQIFDFQILAKRNSLVTTTGVCTPAR